jgi:hypothetical protein
MQENETGATTVPLKGPRPYSELEVRLLTLLYEAHDEFDTYKSQIRKCLSDVEEDNFSHLLGHELEKHPALPELWGKHGMFVRQCGNCHEEFTSPKHPSEKCDCGFRLDSIDYLENPSFTVAGHEKWLVKNVYDTLGCKDPS